MACVYVRRLCVTSVIRPRETSTQSVLIEVIVVQQGVVQSLVIGSTCTIMACDIDQGLAASYMLYSYLYFVSYSSYVLGVLSLH